MCWIFFKVECLMSTNQPNGQTKPNQAALLLNQGRQNYIRPYHYQHSTFRGDKFRGSTVCDSKYPHLSTDLFYINLLRTDEKY